jgi:hypothetical protein
MRRLQEESLHRCTLQRLPEQECFSNSVWNKLADI